ncbi:hypothetical protein M8C21_009702 [Ambrosia artemisiifolia]|uniref:Uncharacterized protein n=1 Tax=Ambrosia artemisiifolia TaxID=4212 RepID=A0AAD5BL84_AMBAR|nr:hypothetical protein M8C21_009702 [Ambrosia artemisiifolia]
MGMKIDLVNINGGLVVAILTKLPFRYVGFLLRFTFGEWEVVTTTTNKRTISGESGGDGDDLHGYRRGNGGGRLLMSE